MESSKQCMQCMEFYDAQYDICPYCGYEENSGKKNCCISMQVLYS